MFFSVIFMGLLSLLIFIGFMVINKSQLEMSEKITSKNIILSLLIVVVILNQLQFYEEDNKNKSLSGLFHPNDLCLPNYESQEEVIEQQNVVHISQNNTYIDAIANYLENHEEQYICLNLDFHSALVVDEQYWKSTLNAFQEKISQMQQMVYILINLYYVDNAILRDLEQLYETHNVSIYIYSQKQLKQYFYRYQI